jgi:hypothetical protein
MVRYRAQARTRALVVLGDSRVPYNILTGDERILPEKPKNVVKPQFMVDGGQGQAHAHADVGVDKRKMLGMEPQIGGHGGHGGGGGEAHAGYYNEGQRQGQGQGEAPGYVPLQVPSSGRSTNSQGLKQGQVETTFPFSQQQQQQQGY